MLIWWCKSDKSRLAKEELIGKTTKKQEKAKKGLTKGEQSSIIGKLSERTRPTESFKKKDKKIQKTFEKGIDKAKALWYNTEAVAEKGSEMVIEN